uniref:Ig-like domain-containing protein n=1 Tax=Oryzias latipes TaxID=8090 RepID=A0A3P9L631_ORYLA
MCSFHCFITVILSKRFYDPVQLFVAFIFLLTPNLLCVSDGDLLSVNIGDEVTLPCSFSSSGKRLSWYQQRVGQHPQIISSMYKHSYSKSFNKEFTDRRFSVHTEGGFYSLNISDVQKSDSAMYYCGHTTLLCFCSLLTLQSASEGLQHQSEVPADSQVSSLPPVLLNGHVCGRPVCNADLWFSHQDQDSSAVQYAALDFKQRRETSLTQTTIEESVYSAVRRSH